jgi:hypothetical protein
MCISLEHFTMLDDKKKPVLGSKAQEMLMQDILENAQELAHMFGYHDSPCDFEIIAIEKSALETSHDTGEHPSNIVCYHTEKQRRIHKRRA